MDAENPSEQLHRASLERVRSLETRVAEVEVSAIAEVRALRRELFDFKSAIISELTRIYNHVAEPDHITTRMRSRRRKKR